MKDWFGRLPTDSQRRLLADPGQRLPNDLRADVEVARRARLNAARLNPSDAAWLASTAWVVRDEDRLGRRQ